jgi:hypothetical protein
MDIRISHTCLETMLKSGMIRDFTDDGFVYREDSGWVPAGDVIEFYLGMEEYELEKAKETVRASVERRAEYQETKEAQAFSPE